MPNERVKQIPAGRAQLGKYSFEIRRFTPSGKKRHAPADGTQSAGVT
jgi:hypothetical protein